MNYYPHHIGDYIKDTAHLEPLEDLCYRRLLDLYYDTERPISLETQSVSRRLRLGFEIVEKVLREFFTETLDGWRHARCDMEIAEYNAKVERARANGRSGGRPKKPDQAPINQATKPSGLFLGSENKPNGNPEETGLKANQNQNQNQNHIINTPLIPQGGDGGMEVKKPKEWIPTDQQKIVNSWFKRRDSTPWHPGELKAWRGIPDESKSEGIEMMGPIYSMPANAVQYRRTSLQTLLNHWQQEIDRCKTSFYRDQITRAANGQRPQNKAYSAEDTLFDMMNNPENHKTTFR